MYPPEFTRFSIDLAIPRDDVDAEVVEAPPFLTGVVAADDLPPVFALAFPSQLAGKVCALYERHGADSAFSSRARDLADIAMIAAQVAPCAGSCWEIR
jgi:hypothetical protein